MSAALSFAPASLVTGDVVHKRLRPKPHALRYRVFSLLLDLDRLEEASARCKLLAVNRAGLLSFHERDHLARERDLRLADQARQLFNDAGHSTANSRIYLLAYPRVFGFAFNPLSVFLLVAPSGMLSAAIYEVANTFGERRAYVAATGAPANDVYAHSFDKELYVSPFAPSEGRYGFRLRLSAEQVLLAVNFRDATGPLIKTHFGGTAATLTTRTAAIALLRLPLLAAKVVAGIHWEALKLWAKGVPLVRRHRAPRYAVTVIPPAHLALKDDHV